METLFRLGGLCLAIFVAFVIVQKLSTDKLENLRSEKYSGIDQPITVEFRERQLDCLALNIYREAGNEPFEGKVGVAQVTLNRVKVSSFPNDVCRVVYQKTVFTEKVICQFSWYCDSTHRNRPINQASYNESYKVAKKVLLEGFKLDMLDKALYYHADYVNPGWNLQRIGKVGTHVFYSGKRVTRSS